MKLDLTILKPFDHFTDLEKVRAAGRVVYNESVQGWMVTSYEDVKKTLMDTSNFGSEGVPFATAFGAEAMLVQDGGLHDAVRRVWSQPFMVKSIDKRRDSLLTFGHTVVGDVAKRMEAGEAVDLVTAIHDFVSDVTIKMMGFKSDRRSDFQRWNRTISDGAVFDLPPSDHRVVARERAKAEMFQLIDAEVDMRRRTPSDPAAEVSLIDLLTAVEGANDISRNTVRDNLLNALLGSLDTSAKWMGNTLAIIGSIPSLRASLLSHPNTLAKVLDEVMRYQTVIQLLVRKAVSERSQIAGVSIPKGDFVYIFPGMANRDPAAFTDPATFDANRTPKLQLGFGFGMHVCLGMNLARAEALLFVGEFIQRCPDFEISEIDYGHMWQVLGPISLKARNIRKAAVA